MTLINAIISLIGAVISGVLATIITIFINHKNEIMREKKTVVAEIFGYRFLLNRQRDAEKFYAALNRVPIVFHDDEEVLQAYEELLANSLIKDWNERGKKMNDSLVTLLKALCKATGIKCNDWNDSKVLNVFGV
ncbi:DUF6680 family protein [Pseudobutyrivibrio sp.]|uniref:DUF6680 family protein n=1 Tax=Pseudobutyrivibrio sp. TaxID=2014367 RepID=UPI001D7A0C3E|nr:DUF6680 family protein [Pseudobutyrivibrio sp.]MBE5910117.1 hypothetical protein [Pseudobutyrivibrio sp.]